MSEWIIKIFSIDLSDEQKRLLKEYLHRKKIRHYAIVSSEEAKQ